MDNDWQFIDGECLLIPVLATYGRSDNTSIIGELTVTKPSDPAVSNDGTFLVLPGDPVSGQLVDEIFVCPADGTGEYRLSSVIQAIEPATEQSFPLDQLTFWVRPATSQMSEVSAISTKGGIRRQRQMCIRDSVWRRPCGRCRCQWHSRNPAAAPRGIKLGPGGSCSR